VRLKPAHLCILAAALFGLTTASGDVRAEPKKEPYFLKEHTRGSETLFNPVSTFVNLGFDITRSSSYENRILETDFKTGFTNTMRNLANPIQAIEQTGGFREFMAREFIPLEGMTAQYSQWVPNYFLHLLGEGMLYRKMAEWYEREGYQAPRIWAASTMLMSALMNETIENGSFRGGNTDPVADLYFFNPVGWLMFNSDNVSQFFSDTVEIGFWPGQPALAVDTIGIYNAGESYFFRWDPAKKGGPRIIGYIGTEGLGGVTLGAVDGNAVSFVAGYRTVKIVPMETNGGRIMIASEPHGNLVMGAFWEDNSSLLASLKIDVGYDPTIRANIYPGLLPIKKVPLGFFVWASQHGGWVSGINVGELPMGVAFTAAQPTRF